MTQHQHLLDEEGVGEVEALVANFEDGRFSLDFRVPTPVRGMNWIATRLGRGGNVRGLLAKYRRVHHPPDPGQN